MIEAHFKSMNDNVNVANRYIEYVRYPLEDMIMLQTHIYS